MKAPRAKPTAYCRLGEAHRGEVIDLVAYRIAERLFWWNAAHDGDEPFEDVYRRVAAALLAYREAGPG